MMPLLRVWAQQPLKPTLNLLSINIVGLHMNCTAYIGLVETPVYIYLFIFLHINNVTLHDKTKYIMR